MGGCADLLMGRCADGRMCRCVDLLIGFQLVIFFRDFYTKNVRGYNWHHAFSEGKIVYDYFRLNLMLTFTVKNINESQDSQWF